MKIQYYKLHFTSAFHISSGGFADESADVTIHSDTLYSAICCAMQLLYGEDFVSGFIKRESVQISSCFPFKGEELFFPRPLFSSKQEIEDINYAEFKQQKKAKFLSKEYFEAALNGSFDLKKYSEDLKSKGKYNFLEKEEIPRVTIDRVSNAASIFNFAQVKFVEGAGLYFMAQFDETGTYKKEFEAALRLLGDEGIGADNTVGKGLFELSSPATLEIKTPENPTHYLLTSLYYPSDDEISRLDGKKSYYDFLTRNGWSTAGTMDLRRLSTRMLIPGSLLNISVKGAIPKVLDRTTASTNYDIVRYGQTIALPIVCK